MRYTPDALLSTHGLVLVIQPTPLFPPTCSFGAIIPFLYPAKPPPFLPSDFHLLSHFYQSIFRSAKSLRSAMGSSQTPYLDSNKRQRPSTHPFLGSLTRSKSQIYLHIHRSGRARHDSFGHAKLRSNPISQLPPLNLMPSRKRRRTRDQMEASAVSDAWPCDLVKDLRTRRVFSPGSNAGGMSVDVGELKQMGSAEWNQRSEDGICSEARVFESMVEENGRVLEHDMKNQKINLVDEFNEEVLQTTPPDAEIYGCRCENGGNKEECITGEAEHSNCKPLMGDILKCESSPDCKDKKNNSWTKLVTSRRSPVKVFKTPGSFSYRRLLPYLMDMAKDNSCAQKQSNCLDVGSQQNLVGKCEADGSSLDDHADDLGMPSLNVPICTNGLSNDGLTDLTLVECITDSSMLYCSSRDASMRVDEYCFDPLVNEQNGKMEMGNSPEDKCLDCSNSDRSSSVVNSNFNEYSNDQKPTGYVESKTTDGERVNYTGHNLSLIREKNQLDIGEVGQHTRDTAKTEAGDVLDAQHHCEASNQNHMSLILSSTEDSRTYSGQNKHDDNRDIVDKTDYSNVQMTPPDAHISDKPELYEDADSSIKCVLQGADQILRKPVNVSIHRNCSIHQRMYSSPKSKLGLNPCSRLKLFKNPTSFSYRRLLPYLMDITKHNLGSEGRSPNLEKSSEESWLYEPSTSDLHETSMDKNSGKSFPLGHDTDGSYTQTAVLTAPSGASNNEQENLMPPEPNAETLTPFASQGLQELPVVDATSDKDGKLEVSHAIVTGICGSNSPTTPLSSNFSLKSLHDSNLVSRKLSVENDGGCTTSAEKLYFIVEPVKAASLSQNSSRLEVSDPLRIPVNGSEKGILKRHPRGCRGSCTCLNCSSFRLNAEKAFEFSKNLMQDAEEVALSLIKELSYLRNMLEKSFVSDDDHVICIDQVKEACREASEAEGVAKARLSEMNYDLNIHCRITCGQRPRVRFAGNMEERANS